MLRHSSWSGDFFPIIVQFRGGISRQSVPAVEIWVATEAKVMGRSKRLDSEAKMIASSTLCPSCKGKLKRYI
jgi:hypothetical protein